MMSISHSNLMPISSERSDARHSQFEVVIDIRQEFPAVLSSTSRPLRVLASVFGRWRKEPGGRLEAAPKNTSPDRTLLDSFSAIARLLLAKRFPL
jgi:hypothetical protein